MFALPPHTTHVAQPLDVTCFHSLKMYWDRECNNYMAANSGKVAMIYQFSKLFSAAFMRAMTMGNIVSGFKKSGIYPVNRHTISIPGKEPAKKKAPTVAPDLARNSGISFEVSQGAHIHSLKHYGFQFGTPFSLFVLMHAHLKIT